MCLRENPASVCSSTASPCRKVSEQRRSGCCYLYRSPCRRIEVSYRCVGRLSRHCDVPSGSRSLGPPMSDAIRVAVVVRRYV